MGLITEERLDLISHDQLYSLSDLMTAVGGDRGFSDMLIGFVDIRLLKVQVRKLLAPS